MKLIEYWVIYCNLRLDEDSQFHEFVTSVKIDEESHVQLQFNGCINSFLPWFLQGENTILVKFISILN